MTRNVLSRSLWLLSSACLLSAARADIALTFDASQLANPAFDTSNLFVTFQSGADATMTVNGTSLTFAGGVVSSNNIITGTSGNITSASFSFDDIINGSGISISSATALTGFISYGSSAEFANQSSAPGAFNVPTTRYSNFEITTTGTAGANLTNIVQFGGALRMDTLDSGGTSLGHIQNFRADATGPQTTGALMAQLAAINGNTSASVITSGGQYVRVIGPSAFNPANTATAQPYRSFNTYLTNLRTRPTERAPPPRCKTWCRALRRAGRARPGCWLTPAPIRPIRGRTTTPSITST